MISKKYEYAYLAITKTGTRSIYKVLKTYYDGSICADHRQKFTPNTKNYFRFTTVRNPYDRACSAYGSVITKRDQYHFRKRMKMFNLPIDMLGFIRCIHGKHHNHVTVYPQAYWLKHNSFDRIIQQEFLEEEFMKLPFVCDNKKDIVFPHVNSSRLHKGRLPTIELLNDKIINLINDHYSEDFKLLDYPKVKSLNEYIKKYKQLKRFNKLKT